MSEVIKSVKGTRDYYPEDMAIRTWLYDHMRTVAESFGYQEYEGPILETFELYAAKSSEEIVEKQSYVFTDRSGDKITLRPELTPTLARMVAKKQNQLTFPLRWWSFGPFWRYERPQKGRTREFFQWNIDQLGEPSPEADAELIIIAATFLKNLGLTADQVQIRVNDRQLMEQELSMLDITGEMQQTTFQLIDRKDKMKPEIWTTNGLELGLTQAQLDAIEKLLENKDLWKNSDNLKRIFEIVDAYGMRDYISYDSGIIRGLLYYTSTVFEAWDTAGDFRALFGGGRYDELVSSVGGSGSGAVGFAVGDLVITLLLEKLGLLPDVGHTPAEVFVTLFDDASLAASMSLSQQLRQSGLKVTNHLKADKLGKQFKHADRIGARLALVIGPEEAVAGQVSIKDLKTGEQNTIAQEIAAEHIKKLLEGQAAS